MTATAPASPAADSTATIAGGPPDAAGSRPGTGSDAVAAGGGDSQEALARLLRHLQMAAGHPWQALALQVVRCAVAAGAGTALRLVTGLPPAAAAGIGAAVVLAGLLYRRPARPSRHAPAWAAAAEAGPPAGVLAAEQDSVAEFAAATGRGGGFVQVATCQPHARYPGLCEGVLIFKQRGHLLVVVGEHVAALAAAPVAHELAHLTGWRQQLARATATGGLAGWLLAGWAAGWPGLLAAGALIQAVTMLASWAVEVGCDQQAARQHGPTAVITSLRRGHCPATRMPTWERRASTSLRYLTGLAGHPPVRARCQLARTLTRTAGDGSGVLARLRH